ncbi:hypothetical protein EV363DRAFT_1439054 [Boletus edulis]|uniref:Uncharacterized protein n=1 Tax=Boletus edulis BED1 TaxID=1328754 RepID=A0AAD4BFR1_BOLED|nr:hypothetical protein EV363DRAFT_1439054 [Boletus edulis]KAF8425363.1 hypothetical protein L210DRAFT_3634684 [Boletus edulis BED1]
MWSNLDIENVLPKVVEKGVQIGEDWITKVEPGLSSFRDNPEGVAGYLEPFIRHAARTHIQPSLKSETPLFPLATAGMRLLEPLHLSPKTDRAGQAYKSSQAKKKVSLGGWTASSGPSRRRTGSWTWAGHRRRLRLSKLRRTWWGMAALVDVRLRLLGGAEIKHKVFVTTWLGYGTNQAKERYVAEVIGSAEAAGMLDDGVDSRQIQDPC